MSFALPFQCDTAVVTGCLFLVINVIFAVNFIILCAYTILSEVRVAEWPPSGKELLTYSCSMYTVFSYSHFYYYDTLLVLIVSVPGHWLYLTFMHVTHSFEFLHVVKIRFNEALLSSNTCIF